MSSPELPKSQLKIPIFEPSLVPGKLAATGSPAAEREFAADVPQRTIVVVSAVLAFRFSPDRGGDGAPALGRLIERNQRTSGQVGLLNFAEKSLVAP